MQQTSDEQGFFSTLAGHRELLDMLTARNLKIRYKGSALGFLWSLLTPGFFILMYAVFARILKFNNGSPHYLEFLVSGIIIWQFTAGCLNDSLNSISGNSNLVKKVFFPRVILPVSAVVADLINFALTFAVLVAYLLISGAADFRCAYWIMPALLMQLTLCTGLACFCASSNVFFRDMQHIVGIVSQAWFFMSPVFYGVDLQLSFLPRALSWLAYLNPMTGILGAYRAGLMGDAVLPAGVSSAAMAVSAAMCLAVFAAGLYAMRAGDKKFGDVL